VEVVNNNFVVTLRVETNRVRADLTDHKVQGSKFTLEAKKMLVNVALLKRSETPQLHLYPAGPLRQISLGNAKSNNGHPLASGVLVETCIACLHSNQNIDQTAAMVRFRNKLIVVLAGLDYRKVYRA